MNNRKTKCYERSDQNKM